MTPETKAVLQELEDAVEELGWASFEAGQDECSHSENGRPAQLRFESVLAQLKVLLEQK
jgi:hypothetical protein